MWRTIFSISLLHLSQAARLVNLVQQFPQAPDTPNFQTYSGYLQIPNSPGKNLFYVMVQSQNDPDTDPVVLWLNGGPGCSSMDGLFQQHGPYIFKDSSLTLQRNPYSWNTNATIIYLDSPAGVGFSIVDQGKGATNDQQTAHDSLQALIQLFKLFPQFRDNDFYITGQSYAGIYVPTLAYNVIMHNQYTLYNRINLKGIAVGNGCTDWSVDTSPALMKMAWSHQLIWWDYYEQLEAECENLSNFNSIGCQYVMGNITDVLLNNVNIYNLYGDCPHHPDSLSDTQKRFRFLKDRNKDLGLIPPCASWKGIYNYLQNTTVRQAFHIPKSVQQWELCTDIDYVSDYIHGSLYTYPFLIKSGLRIWVYSGDTDGSVPFVGTREWIWKLNLGEVQDYRSWYVDEQVAGYYEIYEGLTFVTIKGAGHMVPQFKPPQAHYMFNKFLTGDKLQQGF